MEEMMTHHHRTHPSRSQIQTPTRLVPLVASQMLTLRMAFQVEKEKEAVMVEEATGKKGRRRTPQV